MKYTNWAPNEPSLAVDKMCIAENADGEWFTNGCETEYDLVLCSFKPFSGK